MNPNPPSKTHLLLLEDNADFAFGITLILQRQNFVVDHVTTLQHALERLTQNTYSMVLADLTLPDASGMEVVSTLRRVQPHLDVFVLTGNNDAQLAVQALRLGAKDFLTKPIRKKELLASLLAPPQPKLSKIPTQHNISEFSIPTTIVGDSPIWRETLTMLHAAAMVPKTTVLLTGEPGVGKEVAMQFIHEQSARSHQPLIAINVACLPVSLLESELFGYESGAFTGAQKRKKGVFEQADGGTLFLDEIGELPLELQAKLLRVLERKSFRRLGGEKELNPNFRLISATNQPLPKLVKEGRFREDLYHRLKVLEVQLPPLRARSSDIRKFAYHFLARLGAEMGFRTPDLSSEALELLEKYSWPGNVRELRNVIERALVLSRGQHILPQHLPHELRHPNPSPFTIPSTQSQNPSACSPDSNAAPAHFHTTPIPNRPPAFVDPNTPSTIPSAPGSFSSLQHLRLDSVIHQHIQQVLHFFNGNITKASKALGITRQTLKRRLKQNVPTPTPTPTGEK